MQVRGRSHESFPMSLSHRRIRLLALAVASPLFPLAAQLPPSRALTPFERAKATALLRERTSCLGCHRLNGEGGVLAPSLHDVRVRRSPAYIAAMVQNPRRTQPAAAMPREPMASGDRQLIIRFLGGDAAAAEVTPLQGTAAVTSRRVAPALEDTSGATLYRTWCAGCHGVAGDGRGVNARALPVPPARHADGAVMAMRTDDTLFDVIAGGGLVMNRSPRMPAFSGTLSLGEIRALVRHVRTLCRCSGPSWSRDGAE